MQKQCINPMTETKSHEAKQLELR